MTYSLYLTATPPTTEFSREFLLSDSAEEAVFVLQEGSPSFSANKGGTDQTSVADDTFTKVTFGTEDWDVGGYFDTSTSRWTPPAGKYRVSSSVFCSGTLTAGTSNAQIALYKNGASHKVVASRLANATFVVLGGSVLVEADGDDYFELYFRSNGLSSGTIGGGTGSTYFQGEAI